jgi:hypothetical protein
VAPAPAHDPDRSVVGDRDARALFLEAADGFVAVATAVDPARLDDPATDAWTLRELLAHATRGVRTVATTLATPVDPDSRWLPTASAYFAAALSTPGVHAGIVQRARDAAPDVGDDPAGYAAASLAEVRPLVQATPVDQVVQHFAGRLPLGEYLATRVVELVLHSVDVELATGGEVAFPAGPSALARDVLLALVDGADPVVVAAALTGRAVACRLLG